MGSHDSGDNRSCQQLSYCGRASYIGPEMSCIASKTPVGFIKPELPMLVPEPPAGEGWIHKINDEAI